MKRANVCCALVALCMLTVPVTADEWNAVCHAGGIAG